MDAEGWLTSELATCACGACGQPYGESQVRLIAQREELFFVDLACPHCGSQAVAIVSIQLDDDTALLEARRMIIDEDDGSEEAQTSPAISADDVLDVHALLATFDGDVEQLMARLDGSAQ
jgi:hypothetical protein